MKDGPVHVAKSDWELAREKESELATHPCDYWLSEACMCRGSCSCHWIESSEKTMKKNPHAIDVGEHKEYQQLTGFSKPLAKHAYERYRTSLRNNGLHVPGHLFEELKPEEQRVWEQVAYVVQCMPEGPLHVETRVHMGLRSQGSRPLRRSFSDDFTDAGIERVVQSFREHLLALREEWVGNLFLDPVEEKKEE